MSTAPMPGTHTGAQEWPRVPRRSCAVMAGLVVVGLATAVAGLLLGPTCTTVGAGFDCDVVYLASPVMWVTWAALAGWALLGTVHFVRSTRHRSGAAVPIMAVAVVFGWAAAGVVFPPILAVMSALNAGL